MTATFVLLFMLSGSVLVPVKALVLNFLSLTATFGAMVWIFQDGNLSGLLGFTATGSIDTSMPILMDATVVRAFLVPAFMRLAGEANWWAPRPLRRFHDRYGLSESESRPAPAPTHPRDLAEV